MGAALTGPGLLDERIVVSVRQQQFLLGRGMWTMTAVIYGFFMFVVVAIIAQIFTSSDHDGLWFEALWVAGVLCSAWWLLFRMPRRIEVFEDGLHFVARSRTVLIPWASLRIRLVSAR